MTLHDKFIKTDARIMRHALYITVQMAEVAVPRIVFDQVLRRIAGRTPLCDKG